MGATDTVIIILLLIFVAFICWLLFMARGAGSISPRKREYQYHTYIKPSIKIDPQAHKAHAKATAEASKARNENLYAEGILAHWNRKIKRAGENSKRGRRLIKLRDKELDISKRIHQAGPNHPALPKVNPRTGHTVGGVGRAGHKHSHQMPKIKTPKQRKIKAPKAVKKTFRETIIGNSGNWRGKK